MALAPLRLRLAVCQSHLVLAGRLGARPAPDLVTPVVTRRFSQKRLEPLTAVDVLAPDAVETATRAVGTS
jgi:hypothetical protein